jgi:hypothetical protein
MRSLLLFFCLVTVLAGETLAPPIAGIVLDSEGRLESVRGVLGNLLPGDPAPLTTIDNAVVLSAAFSATSGALKTADELLVTDASGVVKSASGVIKSGGSAPAGPALFAFAPDGTLAWVCYPASAVAVSVVSGATLSTAGWGDRVVALGLAGWTLQVLVSSGSQLWAETIDAAGGSVLSQTPVPGAAPAVWFQGGWLVTETGRLQWFAPVAIPSGHLIPVSEPVTALQTAGPNTIAVNGHWLLNQRFQLLEIPVHPRWRTSPPREIRR